MQTNDDSDELPRKYGPLIHQCIEDSEKRFSDLVAVEHIGNEITYKELNARANQLAQFCISHVSGPDRLIGICMRRSIDLIVCIFGILKSGAAYVPLDPTFPTHRLRTMISNCNMAFIFTDVLSKMCIDETDYRVPVYVVSDLQMKQSKSLDNVYVKMDGHDLAYVIFTSGSTGQPKGVMVEHQNVIASTKARLRYYQTSTLRFILIPSISFDSSVGVIFWTLFYGGTLVIPENETVTDLEMLSRTVLHHKVSHLLCVPSLYHAMLEPCYIPYFKSLQCVIVAGENCSNTLLTDHRALLPSVSLYNEFGPTETTVWASVVQLHDSKNPLLTTIVSIGKPLDECYFYVLDENRMCVPRGVIGELFIGGPCVARGYLNNQPLTNECFIINPFHENTTTNQIRSTTHNRLYRTGDLVRYLSDGQTLQFVGRLDQQVKIRGYRVELIEIESVLAQVNNVRETIVIARQDRANQTVIIAYILMRELLLHESAKKNAIRLALHQYAIQHLPIYMVPNAFVLLDAFPLLPNGKINRKALPLPTDIDRLLDRASVEHIPQAETPLEHTLLTIWRHILHADTIGVDDNFFQLGGDSILGIQLISRIRRQCGIIMTIRQLFDAPTIRKLAKQIMPLSSLSSSDSVNQDKCNSSIIITHNEQELYLKDSHIIPLTPIQCWFFEQNLQNANDWSQFVLMKLAPQLSSYHVKESLRKLIAVHPCLSSKYEREVTSDHWIHTACCDSSDVDIETNMEFLDLTHLTSYEQNAILSSKNEHANRSLDIVSGKLWRALLIKTSPIADLTLYIVIHHLAIDGISWRILLEDFEEMLQSFSLGKSVEMPFTTDSFALWASALLEEAQCATTVQEFEFWNRVIQSAKCTPHIPCDFYNGENTMEHSNLVHKWIDSQVTNRLMQVISSYEVTMYDSLLTSLLFALRLWYNHDQFLIFLEGHGRETININLDVSRTVGWFTTEFPVLFSFNDVNLTVAHLKSVHDQLHAVPNRGFNFSLLRYLSENQDIRNALKISTEPYLLFNYLGTWTTMSEHKLIELQGCPALDRIGPMNARQRLIEFETYIIDHEIHVHVTYSKNHFALHTTENLVNDFLTGIFQISNFGMRCSTLELEESVHPVSYSLSPMQSGMLYRALQYPDSDEYLVQTLFTLNGHVDSQRVLHAWQNLIDCHDILRSTFHWNDLPEPCQRVQSVGIQIPFQFIDWSSDTNHHDSSHNTDHVKWENMKIEQFIINQRQQLFDLQTPPLCRVTLIKLLTHRYLLIFSHHHILLDGWSTSLLIDQFIEQYNQLHSSKYTITQYSHFIDYIHRQRHHSLVKVKTFWQEYLHNLIEPCHLTSVFRHLPAIHDASFIEQDHRELTVNLSNQLLQSINSFCRHHAITVSALFVGCWAIVLSRYLQRSDIVFGITISGRTVPIPAIEYAIGLFINTIPLRITTDCNQSFEILNFIQQQLGMIQEMGNIVSLAEIQSWNTSFSGQSLFDTLFVIENYPVSSTHRQTDSFTCQRHILGEIEKAEYPLTICVMFDDDKIQLTLNYKSKSFRSSLIIERLTQHYLNVINNVLIDPSSSPHSLGLLSNDEVEEQFMKWNNHPLDNAWHQTKPIATIHALVEESARHHSQRTAIIHNQRSITYDELNKATNRLAHYFIDNKYVEKEAENLVVVFFDRSIHFFIAILGVLKAGGAYVPVDTTTPLERLLFIINDTQTRLLLIGSKQQEHDYRQHFPVHLTVLVIDDSLVESNEFCSLSYQTPLSRSNVETCHTLAYVIYTSGSTGTPKGVLIEHRSTIWYRDSAQYHYSFPDGAIYDFSSSIAFDLSVTSTVIPMVNGGTVIVCDDDVKRDIFKFYAHIVKHQVQIIKCTPSFFVQMTDAFCTESDIKLTHLSIIIIGGELLPGEPVRQWLHKFPHQKVFNEYGPTETTVGVAQFLIDSQNVDSVTICELDLPIGKVFPYSGLYILDRNNEPLPFGLTGELYISGPCLARGYLNRNDLTSTRFIDIEIPTSQKMKTRVYRSGDLAYYLDNMDIQCIGRTDRQVKIRGYRVELEEIEHKIKTYLNTSQVYVMKTNERIPRLISFIGGYYKNQQEAEMTLRKHLENTLPYYMHPHQYVFLNQFPLTINEKIDSAALMMLVQSENERNSAVDSYTSPRNLTEFRLYKLWSSLLGVKKFGIYDDFFELGGHSLLIISLIVKIKKIFKRVLSVAIVVRHPTIEKLAKYLTVVFQDNEEDLVLPISTETIGTFDRKPLILIHAIEGISFVYASLASFFDTQQSIIALNSPTFTNLEKKFSSIKEMATFYISIIQKTQLHGPYYLGGWCFGGKVAFEMAHQLKLLNEPVNLILLLDSYLTETYKDFHVYDEEAFDQSIRNYVTGEGINPSSTEAEYFKYEIKNNILMSFEYEPPSYLGRVVLIKADINHDEEDVDFLDPFNGCKNAVQSEIELYSVHCEHTKMFDSVNIDQVAARIKSALSTDTIDPVLSRIDLSYESRYFLHAAHHRDYFFLHRFMELGADINAQDDDGRTALHWAAYFNDCQILKSFKNVPADKIDFNKKDMNGETPIAIARRQNHRECAEILEKKTLLS